MDTFYKLGRFLLQSAKVLLFILSSLSLSLSLPYLVGVILILAPMAFSHACCASNLQIGSNKIPQISKTKLANVRSIPAIHKWNIAEDLTLVSSPLKHNNHLVGYRSFSDDFNFEHAQKLKEVRDALGKVREDPLEDLVMIDTIQRLGIDYHFQDEIEAVLWRQYMNFGVHGDQDYDLYEVALRFRLLRQEGYHVSADVFSCFKDNEGKFKQKLGGDIRGLMGLYEASQLSMEGEDILEEARDLSGQLLNAWSTHLNHHRAKIVVNTLRQPYHKSLARFTAKNFLTNFHGTNPWIHVVGELAKMDFNRVQSVHQEEILQISKWWRDLGLANDLKLARDQPLKWYMWPMAMLTDPSLSEQRVELTKPISLIYIIDDIFDLYGTIDELALFTEAVNRWEFSAIDQLPDYMKACFKALYDITNEIGNKVHKKHGYNPTESLRKTWASLCNAFLVEAKWFASGHLPKAEEYLENGIVSSGVHVVLVHTFFLLGQRITEGSVGLMNANIPGISHSTATILRLWDDLGSAKDENQDGQDGSYVECYMKEHQGCSIESARKHVVDMISDTWKRLNKECLSPNPFSTSFTKGSLNLARMVPLMYSYDDNQCLPGLEEQLKSLLYESFSLQEIP